jgi:phosphatidylglycerol:prolipoprotein diacylglycerol transferase
MNPIIFQLFGHPIRWYGLLTAAGFLAAVLNWNRLARREGFDPQLGSELGVWTILSGILGARLFYVLANWRVYLKAPWEILAIWHGGQIFYGGLIVGIVALCWLARRRRFPIPAFADFAITGVPLGHAIGRLGCFMNGCCFGRASDMPWAVSFAAGDAVGLGPVHPTQLYEAIANLGVYAVLLWFYHRRRRDGTVMALYLLLYPVSRFLLEFTRGDPRQHLGALTIAQGVSIGLFAAGVALWFLLPARKTGAADVPPAGAA